jgi:hypothetical protein
MYKFLKYVINFWQSKYCTQRQWYHAQTSVLTPGSRVLQKLIVAQLIKKFPTIYGSQKFVLEFTRAHHLGSPNMVPDASSQQTIPYGLRSIIWLSHLCLGVPSGLFRFPHRIPLCVFVHPNTCCLPCPSHPFYYVVFSNLLVGFSEEVMGSRGSWWNLYTVTTGSF